MLATDDLAPPDPVLDQIVSCVRLHCKAELVALFGSRASGNARPDSDYDVFVVVGEDPLSADAYAAIHAALHEARIDADLIMRTETRYLRQQRDPGLLDFVVAREGLVLYSTGRIAQRAAGAGTHVAEPPPREGLALWIRRAESDLRMAELGFAAEEPALDAVCFHAHACVEKLLKAIIVKSGTFPPRTHDLARLLLHAPDRVSTDPDVVVASRLLMRLLPRSRYPELGEPTLEEAREALSAARAIRTAVIPLLRA